MDEWGDYITDHIPTVRDRWVRTGLLAPSGRKLLRLQTRPIGFTAKLDQPIYAEEQDSEPEDEDQ